MSDENGIGGRLKKIRESKGLTQEQLAAKCNLTGSYLGRLERGDYVNPTIETIVSLSSALEVHPDEILFSPEKRLYFTYKELGDERFKKATSGKNIFIEEFSDIPLLTGTVVAGDFEQSFSEWSGDTLPVPKGQYKEKDLVAWKIKGRSLEPDYRDGDAVIVSKDFNCTDGIDVVTLKNGSGITIKALKIISDGSVELRPYNADSKTITFESIDEVEAIGEVVGLYRDMRKKRK